MTFRNALVVLSLVGWFTIGTSIAPSTAQLRPEIDPQIAAYQPSAQLSGSLSISGSDSMQPIVLAWTDELQRHHANIRVNIDSRGSETGLSALLEHRASIAAMSRRMTAIEIESFVREYGYEPTEVPVAIDALAVFVHKDNPVTGLALEELDAIFCNQRRRGLPYTADEWGLVGLMDDWFSKPIRIYGRNGTSGTSQFFREEVCKGGTFRPQMIKGAGSAAVILDIEHDPLGIGFSAIGYKTSGVRAVPLAAVKNGRYVEPTLQAAMDGSYPLRRHLYLYVDKNPKTPPSPVTAELIRFALSFQGQHIVVDHGYFPLQPAEIARALAKWVPAPPVNAAQIRSKESPAN
jgi:phosphate transport system substrate-binding protein